LRFFVINEQLKFINYYNWKKFNYGRIFLDPYGRSKYFITMYMYVYCVCVHFHMHAWKYTCTLIAYRRVATKLMITRHEFFCFLLINKTSIEIELGNIKTDIKIMETKFFHHIRSFKLELATGRVGDGDHSPRPRPRLLPRALSPLHSPLRGKNSFTSPSLARIFFYYFFLFLWT